MYVSPIYRLQQNRDWLLCACPIRWEFKKRGLPQPSRHLFSPAPLLCAPPGQQNEKLQTDRRTAASSLKSFLLTTIWHAERGKQSAQHQFLLFSCSSVLSQQIFYLQLIQRYPRSWGHGKRLPKIYSRDQIRFYLHITNRMNNNCMLYCILFIPQSPIPTLQLI